ncbi:MULTISPECIES: FAD-dependent oxidoreductase [Brucella/Ochrobactrum group]|uniref:FAD-dependent oxidoreductase n=1 Tax=Brucella/Ochrobactrum group TaxID=2826938 RepID=UPI0024BC0106|nr:FAD-dependent oxidoreductase [Brucella sp. NM4]WHS30354.1 FAD-dependent oxidoreductase [Brucella sp. NM4]WHT45304.1 FAD-dependent oxidoreductase [Ochrobactrum sp. SSR]
MSPDHSIDNNDPMVSSHRAACDVLVIGSGAGGLSAAVAAAHFGLKVIVAEKADVFGGTTAFSGGWLWIPNAPHAVSAGKGENPDEPKAYLRHILGNSYDEAMIDGYLKAAPRMLSFFERNTQVRFNPGSGVPDFHGNAPAAATGWRSVVAAPYDGRELGSLIGKLRPPIPETTFLGMGIASGVDMRMFLTAIRSLKAFAYVTRRVSKHLRDLVVHRRAMQLVNGNALVARLLRSASDKEITLWSGAAARELTADQGRVTGAVLMTAKGPLTVTAKHGVVLATGGFPHDKGRLFEHLPHVRAGTDHASAAPKTNSGDGMRLAEMVGGHVSDRMAHGAAYAPVSLVPRNDGTVGRFPHLVERGKPGVIAVLASGSRFANEGGPYHDYVCDMIAATPEGQPVVSWLICDHRFLRRYGLGAVKPAPVPYRRWLNNGYLIKGATITELAERCGIDAAGLNATVTAFNRDAQWGEDPQFNRGQTLYQRVQGDPDQKPNPCIAPIRNGPFYAVRIVPGSLGTFTGIVTDAFARVLDASGQPIAGLYAAGNDMNSIMGGHYPSGGITLGPAMTFGFLAAETIAKRAAIESAQSNSKETEYAI